MASPCLVLRWSSGELGDGDTLPGEGLGTGLGLSSLRPLQLSLAFLFCPVPVPPSVPPSVPIPRFIPVPPFAQSLSHLLFHPSPFSYPIPVPCPSLTLFQVLSLASLLPNPYGPPFSTVVAPSRPILAFFPALSLSLWPHLCHSSALASAPAPSFWSVCPIRTYHHFSFDLVVPSSMPFQVHPVWCPWVLNWRAQAGCLLSPALKLLFAGVASIAHLSAQLCPKRMSGF